MVNLDRLKYKEDGRSVKVTGREEKEGVEKSRGYGRWKVKSKKNTEKKNLFVFFKG